MALPLESNIQLPLLRVLADAGGELPLAKAVERVSQHYDMITPQDLAEPLQSGGNKWSNRIQWTRFHLIQRAELCSPSRGMWKITEAGLERLKREWDQWTPEYTSGPSKGEDAHSATVQIRVSEFEDLDPYEKLESSQAILLANITDELMDRIEKLSPGLFESLIGRLLGRIGLHNVEVTGRSGDGGIDGICFSDVLGLDKVAFQAKHWQSQVSPQQIRDFIGALELKRVRAGIFVTTSDFSDGARSAAHQSGRVALVNGVEFVRLMIKVGLGVSKTSLDVPRIDEDFFDGLA